MKHEIFEDGVFQPMEFFILIFHLVLLAVILIITYLGLAWAIDAYQYYYPEDAANLMIGLNSPAPVWLILAFWMTTFKQKGGK